MSISIGATSISDMIVAAQDSFGIYWLSAKVYSAKYALEKIKAPAQSGFKVKRHGFAGRNFIFEILVVDTSNDECINAMLQFEDDNSNKNIRIITGGETYNDCEFNDYEIISGPKVCETGKYLMRVRINCEQLRVD